MKIVINRPIIRIQGLVALVALFLAAPANAQESHPFSGFTLMEIHDERIHQIVGINPGFAQGKSSLLLTLIAGNRGYASVTKNYLQNWPDCMSWINPERGPEGQITVGQGDNWFPFTETGLRIENAGPNGNICGEFTLQRLGPKQALFIKDDIRVIVPIIANFPVQAIDWSDPLIARYRINGYGLGPVTMKDFPDKFKSLSPGNEARKKPQFGRLKYLGIYLRAPGEPTRRVQALADVDRLLAEGQAEIVNLRFTGPIIPALPGERVASQEMTYQYLQDRFGTPSAEFGMQVGSPIWVWAHDLDGRFLSTETDKNDPCLSRIMLNVSRVRLPPVELEAWSCGVVMIYGVGGLMIFHGHAMAHHFFSDRLQVVETARQNVPVRTPAKPDELLPTEDGTKPGGRERRRQETQW
jgi:hypothetical protein